MKNKRLKLLVLSFIGIIIVFITLFILILNVKSEANSLDSKAQITSPESTVSNRDQELHYLNDILENKNSNELKEDLELELDLKTEFDELTENYIPLTQLETYLHIKHTLNVRQHPELLYDEKVVTFNLNTKFIQYDNQTFEQPFAVNNEKVYIPKSFITDYYGITIFKTKVGNKLTPFKDVPILLYHTVNDGENNTLNTQPEQFEKHIKALVFNGYTGISPQELYDFYYDNGTLPDKPVFINFDDGAKDVYTGAYPILQKYGMKATLFIIASKVEHEGINHFPHEIAKISWEDAKAMEDLVTIQSHTWDSHRKIVAENKREIGQIAAPQRLENGSYETKEQYISRITDDINKAQKIIIEKLGYPSIIFSFPYGEYSKEAISIANQLGSYFAVSVNQGHHLDADHLFTINRTVVDGNLSGEALIERIEQ